MEQQKRENGYYWVKLSLRWAIAEWLRYGQNGVWHLTNTQSWFIDSDFEEIDERKIERGEHSRLLQSAISRVEKERDGIWKGSNDYQAGVYDGIQKVLEILNSEI